jgi:hypothetical protein
MIIRFSKNWQKTAGIDFIATSWPSHARPKRLAGALFVAFRHCVKVLSPGQYPSQNISFPHNNYIRWNPVQEPPYPTEFLKPRGQQRIPVALS